MIRKIFFVTIISLIITIPACGQAISWDDFAEEYLQDDEEGGGDSYTLYEELLELHRNPINLNKATREDLLKMPFLNEAQADSILSLVASSGGLLGMGELQFVRNLRHKERSCMMLFFYCPDEFYRRDVAPRDSLPRSTHKGRAYPEQQGLRTEVSSTFGVPLYRREGFKSHTAAELEKNPNKQYLGNNISTTLRYRSQLDNRIFWGLTAQKDEGEPFASHQNTLYDSYSLYLSGRGRGLVQQWFAGDYRAHFAMGLTIGSSTTDPTNILSSYRPRQSGFTRHTSTDEALFLRGGAITMKTGSTTIMAFASWRQMDATLSHDSISTIITNGYHRTPLEMSKRHNIQALQAGISTSLKINSLTLGINATHTHYDTPYQRPKSLYRTYYFEGRDFGNYSLSYSWRHNALRLWGETATSLQGGIATIHRIMYAPRYSFNLHLLHRYYAPRYLSATAQSYKVGSRIQNEHGILLGANWNPTPLWRLTAYADYAHYPFAVFATDHPSNAITTQMQAEYSPSATTTLLMRYKYRLRPQDNTENQLDYKHQHTFKLQARYTAGPLALYTTGDLILLSQPDKDNTSGWMLSQKAGCNLGKSTRIDMAGAVFHTDSYSEALRLYEHALLYSSSYPVCYYHGQHLSASIIQKIGPFSLALKYSLTHYTNRDTIGSGLRAYNGSTLQDITAQLVMKL